jgi:hypothetical protein
MVVLEEELQKHGLGLMPIHQAIQVLFLMAVPYQFQLVHQV